MLSGNYFELSGRRIIFAAAMVVMSTADRDLHKKLLASLILFTIKRRIDLD
jgi:hypothetical protein